MTLRLFNRLRNSVERVQEGSGFKDKSSKTDPVQKTLQFLFKVRNLKYVLLMVVFVSLGIWWWVTPKQQSIRPANVGTRSFSVGWYTDGLSKGCAWAVPSIDPREWLKVCEVDKRGTHLLMFAKAKPETSYNLVLVNGLRVKFKGIVPVVTKKLSDEPLKNPAPAYGNVIGEQDELVPGALVYIYAQANQFHYPVAVKTNLKGNYAVDISELKSLSETLVLEVVASAGIWNDMKVSSQYHEPLPSIRAILK
jgi:hypothetical protein